MMARAEEEVCEHVTMRDGRYEEKEACRHGGGGGGVRSGGGGVTRRNETRRKDGHLGAEILADGCHVHS